MASKKKSKRSVQTRKSGCMFRNALDVYLEKNPSETQSSIAAGAGIGRANLNKWMAYKKDLQGSSLHKLLLHINANVVLDEDDPA